jgi:P27 family predicted phage terminase small subunit
MGRRGPRPGPTTLKLLRGNPGRRPLNPQEPQFPKKIPKAPAHLDPVARKEWRRVVKPLAAAGLLTDVDRAALSGYCVAWARWIDAESKLKEFGSVLRSPSKGFPVLSPYLIIANAAMNQMRRFLSDFGMSPATRSQLRVDQPAPPSKLEAFKAKHGD